MATRNRQSAGEGSRHSASGDHVPSVIFEPLERRLLLSGDLFGPQQIITADAYRAASVYAADIDGDGDMDVLSASFFDGKIAWYENSQVQAQGPEMSVSGNGLSVGDGDTTPELEDHTDFGIMNIDGQGCDSDVHNHEQRHGSIESDWRTSRSDQRRTCR